MQASGLQMLHVSAFPSSVACLCECAYSCESLGRRAGNSDLFKWIIQWQQPSKWWFHGGNYFQPNFPQKISCQHLEMQNKIIQHVYVHCWRNTSCHTVQFSQAGQCSQILLAWFISCGFVWGNPSMRVSLLVFWTCQERLQTTGSYVKLLSDGGGQRDTNQRLLC